jgi:hypothetical protein
MAFPTAVNAQITDAITQTNTKVLAESPAMAMGQIYQTLAQSTGLLIQNAVNAQQQMEAQSQAATAQGVILLYTVDTASSGAATGAITSSGAADLAATVAQLNALSAQPNLAVQPDAAGAETDARPQAADADAAAHLPAQSTSEAVRAAIEFTDQIVFGHASAVIDGARAAADAMAEAIHKINRAARESRLNLLLDAAVAATLARMLREPGKSAEYDAVLEAIKRLR